MVLNIFEDSKKIDEQGNEFWYARELQKILEYAEWRNFYKVIEKAKIACESSGIPINTSFVEVNKTVETPINKEKIIEDFILSRYACYLILQNGDPKKEIIALGQTYFAIQTRKQELVENFDKLGEEQKRLGIRNELREHNKYLVDAAKDAGVKTPQEYATFQNYGYMGLYDGEKAQDIKKRKGLKKNEQILDHMGSAELAANLFRATQTEEKIKNENIQGKNNANKVHEDIGKIVREAIAKVGGTMPENLPTPEKSVKVIEKEQGKLKGK